MYATSSESGGGCSSSKCTRMSPRQDHEQPQQHEYGQDDDRVDPAEAPAALDLLPCRFGIRASHRDGTDASTSSRSGFDVMFTSCRSLLPWSRVAYASHGSARRRSVPSLRTRTADRDRRARRPPTFDGRDCATLPEAKAGSMRATSLASEAAAGGTCGTSSLTPLPPCGGMSRVTVQRTCPACCDAANLLRSVTTVKRLARAPQVGKVGCKNAKMVL